MSFNKFALFGASLILVGTSCQMVAQGPQLTTGTQRSAVGLGYETTTASAPSYNDLDVTSLLLNVSHGWFVANNAEIGGKLIYEGREADDGVTKSEFDAYLLAAFARFYFDGGTNLYPYGEGLLGIGNVDFGTSDDDFMRMSLGIGVMNFLTESTALDAIVKYEKDSYDLSEVDIEGIRMELGYSVFW